MVWATLATSHRALGDLRTTVAQPNLDGQRSPAEWPPESRFRWPCGRCSPTRAMI